MRQKWSIWYSKDTFQRIFFVYSSLHNDMNALIQIFFFRGESDGYLSLQGGIRDKTPSLPSWFPHDMDLSFILNQLALLKTTDFVINNIYIYINSHRSFVKKLCTLNWYFVCNLFSLIHILEKGFFYINFNANTETL